MGGHRQHAGACSRCPMIGCLDLFAEILGGRAAGMVFEYLVEGGFGTKARFEGECQECFMALSGIFDLTDHFRTRQALM